MSYIKTVAPEEATGEVASMYQADLDTQEYIANYGKAFGLRPEVMAGWIT